MKKALFLSISMMLVLFFSLSFKQVKAACGISGGCNPELAKEDGETKNLGTFDISGGKSVIINSGCSEEFLNLMEAFHEYLHGMENITYFDSNFEAVDSIEDSVIKVVSDWNNHTVELSSTQTYLALTSPATVNKTFYGLYNEGENDTCTRPLFDISLKYDKPLTEISSVNLTVTRPVYGDTVTVNDSVQSPTPTVTLNSENITFESAVWKTGSSLDAPLFNGTFEEGTDYYAFVNVIPKEDFIFGLPSSFSIIVNEEEYTGEIWGSNNGITLCIKIEPKKMYSITDPKEVATAIFTFEKNHEFSLTVSNILEMSTEEIADAYHLSGEEFNTIIEFITGSLEKYGALLGLYDITISDGTIDYSSSLTLKLNLEMSMKKYSKLQLVYLDSNDNFAISDVKDLTIGSDTADVDLDHLSVYALVGSEEKTEEQEETVEVEEEKTENPKTGDRIVLYLLISVLGTLGLLGAGIHVRKNRFN